MFGQTLATSLLSYYIATIQLLSGYHPATSYNLDTLQILFRYTLATTQLIYHIQLLICLRNSNSSPLQCVLQFFTYVSHFFMRYNICFLPVTILIVIKSNGKQIFVYLLSIFLFALTFLIEKKTFKIVSHLLILMLLHGPT